MNRIYRLVYNHALGLMQVTSEIGTCAGRGRSDACTAQRPLLLAALAGALLLASSLQAGAQSLPQNGQIITGSASINSSGNLLSVNQSTQSALIQWQSFSIGAGNLVNFNLPSPQSVSINQVTGGMASVIAGNMTSNGQVFLLNPSGIAFTSSAYVNVGGLLASTLNVGTPSLPVDGGPLPPMFQLAGGGTGATISNDGGTLTASDGGISLVGGAVSNNGMISAPNGSIDLVAAGGVLVTPEASSTGNLRLSFATTAASTAAAIGVINNGALTARSIGMNAMVGPGLASHGINTSGTITANAIDAGDGVLTIRSNAAVLNSATITAAAADIAGSSIDIAGGSIYANGARLTANTGSVNVSGTLEADSIELTAATVSQGSSGALQGAVRLDVQGAASLSGVDNRIGAVAGTVGGDLTLVTRSALSNSGALQVTGSTRVTAVASGASTFEAVGDITLDNPQNKFGGSVALKGGTVKLSGQGNLSLGDVDAQALTVSSGSSISQSTATAINVDTTSSFTATNGITLREDGNVFGGAVTLQAGGAAQLVADGTLRFGNIDVGSLSASGATIYLPQSLTTQGAQSWSGALLLEGDTSLSSSLGGLSFYGTLNGPHALSLDAAAGTVHLGAISTIGSLSSITAAETQLAADITTEGNLDLGRSRVQGDVALTSTLGSVRINGALDGTTVDADALAITAANQVAILGAAGGAGRLHDLSLTGHTVSTAAVDVAHDLTIDSVTSISQTHRYGVGGTSSFSSDGDITLQHTSNQFLGDVALRGNTVYITGRVPLTLSGVQANILNANAEGLLTLRDAAVIQSTNLMGNAVQLDSVALGQTSTVTAMGGSISQDRALRVDGGNTWTAAGDILLENTSNRFTGVTTLSGRDVRVAAGDLTLGMVQASRDLRLVSSGSIQQQAKMSVGGAADLRAAGDITLRHINNSFAGDVALQAAQASLYADQGLSLVQVDVDGLLATTLGLLSLRDAQVTGLADLYGVSLALARADVGRLDANAFAGGISQSDTVTLGDGSELRATGNVMLDRPDNRLGSGLQVRGTDVVLSTLEVLDQADVQASGLARLSGEGVRLGTVSAGSLQVYSQGDIDQGVALQVTGDSRFSASGDIRLGHAGNQLAGGVQLAGRDVRIENAGHLRLDGVVADGNFFAMAHGGGIGQTASIEVDGRSDMTARDDITLQQAGNTFGDAVALDASAIRLAADSSLDVDGLRTRSNGTAQLEADGNLTLSGDAIDLAGGSLLANAIGGQLRTRTALNGAAVVLQGRDGVAVGADITGGQVILASDAGDVVQEAGRILAVDASALVSNSGDIVVENADNRFNNTLLLIGEDIRVTAGDLQLAGVQASGDLSLTSSGNIVQSMQVVVDGTSRFAAGGDITLQHADNRLNGQVEIDGRDVQLYADAGLNLQAVNARNLDAHAGNTLVLDNATVSGDATVQGQELLLGDSRIGGNLVARSLGTIQQTAALRITGTSQLQAGGGIQLEQAGNHFGGRVDIDAASASITSADSMQLGNITTTGDLQVGADAGLRLDGQIRAANVDLATSGIFDNRAGSSAIALSGPGRWQVYLASPFKNHVFGGLDSGNTALWNTAAFANATGSANRYLFAWQPTLTVTANTLRKIYGDSLDPRNAVSITGAMAGVTGAYLADNVAELITGTPLLASTGASATAGVSSTPYALDISAGTLDTGASGYALSFVQGELWVDPRALTITAIDGWKMIGQSLTLHDYSVDGLKNDDTVDSVRLFSAGSMVSALPGRYEILVSDAVGAGLGNYDIHYQGGKLDVGGTSDQTAALAAQLVAAGLPRLPTPLPAAVPSPLISVSDGGISQPAACTGAQRGSCLGMQPE